MRFLYIVLILGFFLLCGNILGEEVKALPKDEVAEKIAPIRKEAEKAIAGDPKLRFLTQIQKMRSLAKPDVDIMTFFTLDIKTGAIRAECFEPISKDPDLTHETIAQR